MTSSDSVVVPALPGAVAAELLNSEELVQGVLSDVETSGLSEPELFRFARKVNEDSVNTGPADIALLHGAGYTDEAIYYALTVCAFVNLYNRWTFAKFAASACPGSEK